eukprot:365377-Chlamydomonas_euryale.AAC.44
MARSVEGTVGGAHPKARVGHPRAVHSSAWRRQQQAGLTGCLARRCAARRRQRRGQASVRAARSLGAMCSALHTVAREAAQPQTACMTAIKPPPWLHRRAPACAARRRSEPPLLHPLARRAGEC